MSDDDPLAPPLAALFRDASLPAPAAGAKERVLSRLELALPGLAPANSPGAGPAIASHVVGRTAIVFVLGAIAGGGAVAALHHDPEPRTMYIERVSSPAPPATTSPDPVPSSAVVAPAPEGSATAVRPATPVPSSSARADGLARERLLLDDARTRLASGDAEGALAKLREHARAFPHGQLDEEREALLIQALVNTGNYDDARARAASFRKRSPNSVFLSVIDVSLSSIP